MPSATFVSPRALAVAGLLLLAGCTSNRSFFAHYDHLSTFTYLHRPTGYHWVKRRNKDGSISYYGADSATGNQVYVGPDGIYYTFRHPGNIEPDDLSSWWSPHDADS